MGGARQADDGVRQLGDDDVVHLRPVDRAARVRHLGAGLGGRTVSATYWPDGQLLTQSLPGGVRLDVAYDADQAPVTRTDKRASDGG
jgi:YD repeat-containing protein